MNDPYGQKNIANKIPEIQEITLGSKFQFSDFKVNRFNLLLTLQILESYSAETIWRLNKPKQGYNATR